MIRDRIMQQVIREQGMAANQRRSRVPELQDHPMRLPLQNKLLMSEIAQDNAALALEVEGAAASLYLGDENAPAGGQWPMAYMNSFGFTIAAGTSHEVAVLEGAVGTKARYRSRYRNAAIPEASWCVPAHGWLRNTREGWSQNGTIASWDTGFRSDGTRIEAAPNIGGRANKARIQWRQSMNLRGNVGALSVSPGTSPFWNVRALDTAIRNHAAWANYPIWCALNQMVLDDVTAKVAPPPVPDPPQE